MSNSSVFDELKAENERYDKAQEQIIAILSGWSVTEVKTLLISRVINEVENRSKLP